MFGLVHQHHWILKNCKLSYPKMLSMLPLKMSEKIWLFYVKCTPDELCCEHQQVNSEVYSGEDEWSTSDLSSNSGALLEQWYKWLGQKIEKTLLKIVDYLIWSCNCVANSY